MATNRYTLVLYGALVVGAAATYGVYRYVEVARASNQIATLPVVVAASDIQEGMTIDRLAVTVAQWPAPTVPAGVYGSVDSVAGRVARIQIFKGEAIVPGRLAPDGTGAGLEVKIPPGKRAMSVRINDVSGIGGLIQPNARVDIILTMNPTQGQDERTAKVFMENMKILAMGQQSQRGDDGRPIETTVATLEVTPEESEKLALAEAQGAIRLVLRGYGDPDSTKTQGAQPGDLLGPRAQRREPPRAAAQPSLPRLRPFTKPEQNPAPATAAPAPAPVVQRALPPESLSVKIIRGSKQEVQKFDTTKAKKDSIK